jgi:hypothetical protein
MRFVLLAMTLVVSSAVVDPTSEQNVAMIIAGQSQGRAKSIRRGRNEHRALKKPKDAPLVCQVMVAHVLYEKGVEKDRNERETVYSCMTTPDEEVDGARGMVYRMGDDLVATIKGKNTGKGLPKIQIYGATAHRSIGKDQDVIVAPTNADVVVMPSERLLKVENSFGIRTVLALRVSSLDSTNTLTASTISSRLFGGDGTTLSSVYADCSWNALNMIPATGTGITNGVAEIFIDQNTIGASAESVENAITAATEAQLEDLSGIDHIMYCVSTMILSPAPYCFLLRTPVDYYSFSIHIDFSHPSKIVFCRCLLVLMGEDGLHTDTLIGVDLCSMMNGVGLCPSQCMRLGTILAWPTQMKAVRNTEIKQE